MWSQFISLPEMQRIGFFRFLLKSWFWALPLFMLFMFPIVSIGQESLLIEPVPLAEESIEQEGSFFNPSVQKAVLENPGRSSLEKLLQSAIKSNNKTQLANTAIQLAWIEYGEGSNAKSLEMSNTALNAILDAGNAANTGLCELLVAWFQIKMNQSDEALKTTQAIISGGRANIPKAIRGSGMVLMAQAFLLKRDWVTASTWFLNASREFAFAGNKSMEARCLVQAAECLIRKGVPSSEPELHLRKAANIFVSLNEQPGKSIVSRDLGILRFKSGQYEASILEFQKGMDLYPNLSTSRLLKDAYLKLSTINTLSGNHKMADDLKIKYELLRDSIDKVERSRTLSSRGTRRDLMERAAINDMLRKEIDFSATTGISSSEIERNRLLIDAEIERLEKEKLIEEYNLEKRKSDLTNQERDEKIRELTRQKELQDLALSNKELQVSRVQAFRNLFIAVSVSIIIISLLLFNRYRHEKKTRKDIDQTYRELSDTHSKLLAAQEQLVHSQKMASLGQLTAGIAHEIQNPLNFVNNFSELSLELIEEMKTAPAETREEILSDIISNLKKINEHGKRADRIVKGMLIHSRAGQPEKTPGDLNKMIEELMELSYHGNRSRDHGFKADIIKHLDPTLPKVNMVMQDISRVLVNLFNNAFYAVGLRDKMEGRGYAASVGVSTSREGDHVVIKIRDNGTGIPEDVKKKIFDPFFTTKPTGEGTGLGLSLSYDIVVKGHGGTMSVASEAGSYTEFIISLPIY
jgi:signal transduction histidine kinase